MNALQFWVREGVWILQNCIRNDLRRPKIPNFPGGTCTLCTLISSMQHLFQPNHFNSGDYGPVIPPENKVAFSYDIYLVNWADRKWKKRLAKEGIDMEECVLSPAQGDTAFLGSRKFVKVTWESFDRCNSLDKPLKSNPHFLWFLRLYPPWKLSIWGLPEETNLKYFLTP